MEFSILIPRRMKASEIELKHDKFLKHIIHSPRLCREEIWEDLGWIVSPRWIYPIPCGVCNMILVLKIKYNVISEFISQFILPAQNQLTSFPETSYTKLVLYFCCNFTTLQTMSGTFLSSSKSVSFDLVNCWRTISRQFLGMLKDSSAGGYR